MQKKLLDELFKQIHLNFEAVRSTSVTFRSFDIEEMTKAGLSTAQATQLYDKQIKQLSIFLKKLTNFSNMTAGELTAAEVKSHLTTLIEHMCLATSVKADNEVLTKKLTNAWYKTTIREANINHALKTSSLYIREFTQRNNILPQLKAYLEVNGFAGFMLPPRTNPDKPAAILPASRVKR